MSAETSYSFPDGTPLASHMAHDAEYSRPLVIRGVAAYTGWRVHVAPVSPVCADRSVLLASVNVSRTTVTSANAGRAKIASATTTTASNPTRDLIVPSQGGTSGQRQRGTAATLTAAISKGQAINNDLGHGRT